MAEILSQQEIDELFENYRSGKLKELTPIHEVFYRKGAEQFKNFITQQEIDELFEKFNVGQANGCITVEDVLQCNMEKFKHDEVYTVEDYDLFYCKYALEELTSCASMLRRYAYGDTESFKKFKYFIVLEEYRNKRINAVLVVGVPSEEFSGISGIYRECQKNGIIYLVDASSVNYAFTFNDK